MPNLWSEILTAAVNLPLDHPAKEPAMRALEVASRNATQETSGKDGIFSDAWYATAVDSIVSDDPAAQRFFIARLGEAYRAAQAELAWRMAGRRRTTPAAKNA